MVSAARHSLSSARIAGVCGGRPGALRSYRINGEQVHPKGRYVLKPGDILEIAEAGGGGYGDPANRDPARVAEDIRQGFVTPEGARRDYGVAAE